MKKWSLGAAVRVVAVTTVVAVLAIGAGFLLRFLLRTLFKGVTPTVATAIAAGSVTGCLSLVTVVVQRRYERQQRIEQDIRQRKIEVYTSLLRRFFDVLQSDEEDAPRESAVSREDALRAMAEVAPEVITWAADPVILAWSRFRRAAGDEKGTREEAVMRFEEALLAIRRDLGHSNKHLGTGDLSAFIRTSAPGPQRSSSPRQAPPTEGLAAAG